jgi:hypothetical protein
MKSTASFYKTFFSASIKGCVFLGLLFMPSLLLAQDRGKVQEVKDPKVDSLIEDYLTGKKGTVTETGTSNQGFRVQIFSGADRNMANSAQAKFQEKYPEIRTYISYHDPFFKVHIGDFRTRLEAEKMVQELKYSFTGLFIISEKINPPKLDSQ